MGLGLSCSPDEVGHMDSRHCPLLVICRQVTRHRRPPCCQKFQKDRPPQFPPVILGEGLSELRGLTV